jgi:hypothetical protein
MIHQSMRDSLQQTGAVKRALPIRGIKFLSSFMLCLPEVLVLN